MEQLQLEVPPETGPERLDRWLANHGVGRSRAYVRRLIDSGMVRVDGRLAPASWQVRPGQRIEVELPPPEDEAARPEPIPLNVVYEDEDILVINKPQGMVVHPTAGHGGTLVNALLARGSTLSLIGGEDRPGIVHRLDKDTSGLIVVAKNDRAHFVAGYANPDTRGAPRVRADRPRARAGGPGAH